MLIEHGDIEVAMDGSPTRIKLIYYTNLAFQVEGREAVILEGYKKKSYDYSEYLEVL